MEIVKNKNKKGFTLVETMISVSLFVVITTVGMGTLLNANSLYRKSHDMRDILNNLNYVMEDISRNARTGYNYHCLVRGIELVIPDDSAVLSNPKSCAISDQKGWVVAFESAYGGPTNNDDQWVYAIGEDGKLYKATVGPYGPSSGYTSFTQMTSDEVKLDTSLSYFKVYGAESPAASDSKQPLMTIRLVGTITYKGTESPFSIQTSVSQRLLDIN